MVATVAWKSRAELYPQMTGSSICRSFLRRLSVSA
jgi:hypothetical protein